MELTGKLNETVEIPVTSFSNCGFCTSNVRLSSEYFTVERAIDGRVERNIRSRVETDCKTISISKCDSVEFRIPFEVYNSKEEFNVPVSIYAENCCAGDSLDLKGELYYVFTDTIRKEYVINVPCYRFGCMCACGGGPPCEKYKFDLPADITELQTRLFRSYTKPSGEMVRITYLYLDSIHFERKCPDEWLTSYGIRNGELVFAGGSFLSLNKTVVYVVPKYPDPFGGSRRKIVDYIQITLQDSHYSPLRYNDVKVKIKVKRKLDIDSVGFYLRDFGYYTPATKINERKYTKYFLLDHHFSIGFYIDGQLYSAESSTLKLRLRKRGKLMKFKIRQKDVMAPVPEENFSKGEE